ncbi:MAG: diguanylate cyclase protein [Rhodocyclaceae bacterium]|nr:diguanylate cyclase protein [Rhodocyclaceae bacterium]
MGRIAHRVWIHLAGLMPGEIQSSEMIWLLSPRCHFSPLTRRRASMIVNRVRLFAFLFAVLTPLWSLVDYFVFPFPLWFALAALRLVTSGAFAALVLYASPSGSLAAAYRAMILLFIIPTAFFVVSHETLAAYELTGLSAAMGAGYAFLPFVLLAGLSIFPLTLAESLVMVSPMLVMQAMPGLLHWNTLDWAPFVGAFWLLLIISAVAILAGLSQLTFMMAMVRQAIRDPLTGAYSRRCGEEVMEVQFAQAGRTRSSLAVAFLDLDDFKSINDRHGHEAGDQALAGVAVAVMAELRRSDILCRWGGEEFIIVMPNTDLALATRALHRIRSQGLGLRPDGNGPLTVSIGIAEKWADDASDWNALVDIADRRMYRAKAGGRNRTIGHGGAREESPQGEARRRTGGPSAARSPRMEMDVADCVGSSQ